MTSTASQGFSQASFDFFAGIEANNNRDWFTDNKSSFKSNVEAPFASLLEALTNRLADAPVTLEGSKKTMFRINRDVRFSEDKSPYKTFMSGMLTRDGTKKEMGGVLYLHMQSDGGFVATGWYNLQARDLAPRRDKMVQKADAFDDVLAALDQAGLALEMDNTLSSMPRGFAEHDTHRHADKIRLKSYLIRTNLTPKDWITGDVIDRAEKLARDAMPMLKFFS